MIPSAAPAILVVTGASGAGKTALVEALAGLSFEGVSCHHFDAIDVPADPDEAWRQEALREWLARLAHEPSPVAVLEGSVRPSDLVSALQRAGVPRWRIALVDCDADERNARLRGPRDQPDLATPRMDSWAAYLRGQADALGLPVIDTTGRTLGQCLPELITHVRALAPLP